MNELSGMSVLADDIVVFISMIIKSERGIQNLTIGVGTQLNHNGIIRINFITKEVFLWNVLIIIR